MRIYTNAVILLLLFFANPADCQKINIIDKIKIKELGKNIYYINEGELLVTASKNKIVFIDRETKEISETIPTNALKINKILVSEDNSLLIAKGSFFKGPKLLVYDLHKKELLKEFDEFKREIIDFTISNSGQHLAAVDKSDQLFVYDLSKMEKLYSKRIQGEPITDMLIADDKIYLTNSSGNVLLLELISSNFIHLYSICDESIKSMAISLDNKKVAFGTYKGEIFIFKIIKGKLTEDVKFEHRGIIYSLQFSPDSRYLFSGSSSETIYVWNLNYNVLKLKKWVYGQGSITSISLHPNERKMATIGYWDRLSFWDISSLDIIPVMKLQDEADVTPPQILVTKPFLKSEVLTVEGASISIEGMVIDDVGVHEVLVSGRKASLSGKGEFSFTTDLAIGQNVFEIVVTDVNGNSALKKFTLVRQEEIGEMDYNFTSTNYLLIIAIDKYKHWNQLNNAVFDAEAVEKVLVEKYKFEKPNIYTVYNEQATQQGIIDAFKNVVSKVGPNDKLLIYYSGHGHFDMVFGEGYWIPYDAEKDMESEYIPNSFLLSLIGRINSKHTFLVADACFSGSLFNESSRGYSDNVAQYKSRWGLASGRLEFVSDGAANQHSPFNKTLVEFLRNNTKDKVPASELVQNVKIRVAELSDQTPIGNPLKNVGDEGGEFVFELK